MNEIPPFEILLKRPKESFALDTDTAIANMLGTTKQNIGIYKNKGKNYNIRNLYQNLDIGDFLYAMTGKTIEWDRERELTNRIKILEHENAELRAHIEKIDSKIANEVVDLMIKKMADKNIVIQKTSGGKVENNDLDSNRTNG